MRQLMALWTRHTASVALDPMPWGHLLAFYLGIPLTLAAVNGANHAGLAHYMTVASGIAYWAGLCVPLWLTFDLATRAAAMALRPWAPALWIVLLGGAVGGLLVAPPYVEWYVAKFLPALGPVPGFQAVRLLQMQGTSIDRMLGMMIWPAVWIVVNYYYDRMLSIPRYRGRVTEIAPPPRDEVAPTEPLQPMTTEVSPVSIDGVNPAVADPEGGIGFLRQLAPQIGHDIVALQAEDHYVRVYTLQGSALVRYRFKDALTEVEPLGGLRIHRSFWVRERHVSRVTPDGDSLRVVMSTGLVVPVSRGSRSLVDGKGWPGRADVPAS